jgi:DNA polymerase-1
MESLCKSLLEQKSVCFDTETTGMDPLLSELVGLSFAFKEGEAYYVPISEDQETAQRQVNIFKPFFENEEIEKVGQNIKYDILELRIRKFSSQVCSFFNFFIFRFFLK